MVIRGLEDYRLTKNGLLKLAERAVVFSVQLAGVRIEELKPLSPKRRDATLRAALKSQLARLVRRFPEAALRSRDPKKGSWTLDGALPANQISRLASQPEVAYVDIIAVAGRSRRGQPAGQGWFCVWGVVAVQVEGKRSGMVTIEDRFVLVKASDDQDAVNRLRPLWETYGEPYLNPHGYFVRWQLVEIADVYPLFDDTLSPLGTEVYSRLRERRMKAEYSWNGRDSAPNKRLQPTAPGGIDKAPRLKRKR